MTTRAQQTFTVLDGPAQGKTMPIEVDDNWHITLDLGDARLASVEASNCVQGTQAPHLELMGLCGTIAINLLDVAAPVEVLRPGGEWERLDAPYARTGGGPDHLLGIEHLVDCIEKGEEPVLSVEHAAHVVEIIEKAGRSSREGCALAVESTFGTERGVRGT